MADAKDEEWAEKAAIVTGGSRGIGRAIARALARRGVNVTIVGRDPVALREACDGLENRIATHAGDAISPDVAKAAVDDVVARCGRLDILVNNVGGQLAMGALLDLGPDHFDRTVAFNLRVPFIWSHAVWHAAMREGGGTILNISSIGGITVPSKMGAYSIAKAGLNQMTRVLAAELAPNVRVNGIAPGLTRSAATGAFAEREDLVRALFPLERVGEPEDIAEAALYLLGEGARWVTGETIVVDGGTLVETGRIRDRKEN